MTTPVPRAAQPFLRFGSVLRANGFAVAPEQSQNFLAAVGLLGPMRMADIHAAALATVAPPPERREAFDALYRAHFLGQTLPAAQPSDEREVREPQDGEADILEPEEENEAGEEASAQEVLTGREFGRLSENEALRRFSRVAPASLPHRRSRRLSASDHGRRPDLRRALRQAVARDGELTHLPRLARRPRQRRILSLVDVSGSMQGATEGTLRFAHALAHAGRDVETFTIGTRLTRVTRALRHRERSRALDAAAAAVPDWDGGTRLGEALSSFLAVPRYAAFARSAFVIIVSDGLERGEPDALIDAVRRLSHLAHAIWWLTPLASGPAYVPQTQALAAIAPMIDHVGEGGSVEALAREVLNAAHL